MALSVAGLIAISKTFQMKSLLISIMFITTLFCGCRNSEQKQSITITGNLQGLPDGKIFLINVDNGNKVIDSGVIDNGKFQIITDKKNRFLTVNLMAKDLTDTTRLFAYPTHKLHQGKPNAFGYFILEDGICVNGRLVDFNFKAPGKLKLVNVSEPVSGKQSWVLYNVTPDFPTSSVDTLRFNKFKEKVLKYPYSYYLLNAISEDISLLTNRQLEETLQLFDKDIKETRLWKRLLYLSRETVKNDSINFKFINSEGDSISMLKPKDRTLNMIIIWASWCGPCIKEIPLLKRVYEISIRKKNLNMISISVDRSFENWNNAVKKYKMPWTQLISTDAEETRKLFFHYKTPSILPTILLLDSQGNLIDKITSHNSNKEFIEKINNSIDIFTN